LLDIADLSIGC